MWPKGCCGPVGLGAVMAEPIGLCALGAQTATAYSSKVPKVTAPQHHSNMFVLYLYPGLSLHPSFCMAGPSTSRFFSCPHSNAQSSIVLSPNHPLTQPPLYPLLSFSSHQPTQSLYHILPKSAPNKRQSVMVAPGIKRGEYVLSYITTHGDVNSVLLLFSGRYF